MRRDAYFSGCTVILLHVNHKVTRSRPKTRYFCADDIFETLHSDTVVPLELDYDAGNW